MISTEDVTQNAMVCDRHDGVWHPQDGADGNVAADSLQFIDFEYGCVSYRGFDWGNHFNEYAGFECDYGRYPDRRGAASFIRHYLAEAHGGRELVQIS